MKQITLRLKDDQNFREEIEALVERESIKAGVIVSAVGGLKKANLRVPKLETGEHIVRELEGPFELVSCMGTLSPDGCHIHVSVSDRDGKCYGGHLKHTCPVFVTVELVVLVFEDTIYQRLPDEQTGFDELTPKVS